MQVTDFEIIRKIYQKMYDKYHNNNIKWFYEHE